VVCPASACGSKQTPPRGSCSMGNCLCNQPWLGSDCTILGLPPQIVQIDAQNLPEGKPYQYVLNISTVGFQNIFIA